MVKAQLTIKLKVPRPGDSKTHPTNALSVGGEVELVDELPVSVIAFIVK